MREADRRSREGSMEGCLLPCPDEQNPFQSKNPFFFTLTWCPAGVLSGRALHDERLATAIAGAWLELPHEVRAKAWPEWAERPMIML